MDTAFAQPRRWTRAEYEQLAEACVFRPDERVELLDGEILTMTPQKSLHSAAVYVISKHLDGLFGLGYLVRSQLPLALDPASEPEPDIAVVPGQPWDFRDAHPTTAELIVEVADTSLRFDRQKGPLYARAGIPEYWIVNLVDGILEVYREPVTMGTGWDYRLVKRLSGHDHVTPLAKPDAAISVADLLPPP